MINTRDTSLNERLKTFNVELVWGNTVNIDFSRVINSKMAISKPCDEVVLFLDHPNFNPSYFAF